MLSEPRTSFTFGRREQESACSLGAQSSYDDEIDCDRRVPADSYKSYGDGISPIENLMNGSAQQQTKYN